MSSIKERAAALNLAEKLCARPPGPGGATRPVQSSSIWSSIVSHLRSTVTVKRRTVHLKSHNDCFLGSDAVDVVTEHIANAVDLEGASVSRDKVACVCQALLRCNVFEAVGTKVFGKNRKRDVFQDGKSALYRFVGSSTPPADELERGELVVGIQKFFCGAPSDGQEEQPSSSEPHVDASVPEASTKTSQLESGFAADLKVDPPVGGLSPSRVQTDSGLPQSLVNEVWQEQTLFRLLNLVELPLLEGVLQCTSSPPAETPVAPGNPDLIYSSNHLDRHILKAFRSSQEDEWLCAALDCLDFLPDQPVVELSRELPHGFPPEEPAGGAVRQRDESFIGQSPGAADGTGPAPRDSVQCKLLLYETLVKHYSCSRPPLLPQPMTDIYMAITDLLVSGSLDRALEALQLCLKLLPQSSREELRTLLSFMSLAADPRGIKLDKEMENRLAVKRSFSRAILHSKTLSKEKEDLLLVFMLSNVKQIFKIPGSLHKAVSEKLARLAGGSPLGPSSRAKTTTNQELWVLLNNINLDPKISTKERKRLLRHFSHAHPEIFNQYFGDSAAAEL
ncbi:DEP domain-containing protein 7 isoform X2 [Kryptolebias marmoratus]|uniref:DEP domain-containing protein 7 isoform X2 n=1 Tax=Kryptolebias marmoratus TaxID=37003 RepID=UPI0007F866D5|nr:DEP domain-containing protein 7 isoform X2 [Kryptolebias marmoratus]